MKRVAYGMMVALVATGASARADIARLDSTSVQTSGPWQFNAVNLNAHEGFTIEAIGDPIQGGSWYQDFYVSAPASFTNLGMMIGNDYPALEGAPSMDFSAGGTSGWAQAYGPPSGATWPIAASTGTSTTELTWRTHFADPLSQSFTLTLFAYDDLGSNIFDGAIALWDGTDWSFAGVPTTHDWETYQAGIAGIPGAPVPSAALLGLMGLACLPMLRKRLQ